MSKEQISDEFGDGEHGTITAHIYRDGDVVVCHGERGQCRNMSEVSGYGPMHKMVDQLDIPSDVETDLMDFVHKYNEIIDP